MSGSGCIRFNFPEILGQGAYAPLEREYQILMPEGWFVRYDRMANDGVVK